MRRHASFDSDQAPRHIGEPRPRAIFSRKTIAPEHAPVVHAKGSWQQSLSRDELKDKLMDCATRVFNRARAADLFEQLWNLEKLGSIRSLRLTTDRIDA